MSERLQKTLARAGVGSRRRCEEYIRQGRVTVNGTTVTEMGTRVDPQKDAITFDGTPVSGQHLLYILLNKPRGYVTTMSDPQGRPIVTDLLGDLPARVFPVGRLDLDSEGALLLTNDGEMTNYILHPRYGVSKTYQVVVEHPPTPRQLRLLEHGIRLDGKMTMPARVRVLSKNRGGVRVQIILHEGKKRQVRKMFAAIGHPVRRLTRTAYGRLKLGGLGEGEYRFLGRNDIKNIFSGKIPFTIKNIPD